MTGGPEDEAREGWNRAARTVIAAAPGAVPYHSVTMPLLPRLVDLLAPLPGRQVLDAGCGEGTVTRLLARAGARVTGVDLAEDQLRIATHYERRMPLGVVLRQASVTDLGLFPDASFDALLSNQVLPSVADHRAALSETARVMRPGGRAVFALLHPCFRHPGPGPVWADGSWQWGQRYLHEVRGSAIFDPRAGVSPPIFHRPLQAYLAAALGAGLMLDAFLEWAPAAAELPVMAVMRFHKPGYLPAPGPAPAGGG